MIVGITPPRIKALCKVGQDTVEDDLTSSASTGGTNPRVIQDLVSGGLLTNPVQGTCRLTKKGWIVYNTMYEVLVRDTPPTTRTKTVTQILRG